MITVSNDNYTILANSSNEGYAIINELERLDEQENRLQLLQRIKHGHKFGDNMICKCGLAKIDYLGSPNSQELCSEYKY